MFTNQGTVIHFNNPKVQASLAANTFTITGHAETKQLTEMLPGILNQLGADSLTSLRRLAETMPKPGTVTRQYSFFWTFSVILCALHHNSFSLFIFSAGDKAPLVAAEEEDDEVPGKCVTSVKFRLSLFSQCQTFYHWLITFTWATWYISSNVLEKSLGSRFHNLYQCK